MGEDLKTNSSPLVGEGREGGLINSSLKSRFASTWFLRFSLLSPSPCPLPQGEGKNFVGLLIVIGLLIFSQSLSAAPHAFPVPFVERLHQDQGISFKDLPGEGMIKILTVNGEEVVRLTIAPGEFIKPWAVTNSSGKKLGTGVYLYLIESGNQKTTGKIVVIR